MTELSHTINHR